MSFESSVFINCPFDKKYKNDILKPLAFVLVRNGLIPRCALETADSGELRIDKIIRLMKECRYSIHDLSLIKAAEAGEFARMNMPFELGIDYGLRVSRIRRFKRKQFLILGDTPYEYMKAISDLNGFDIKYHRNRTDELISSLYKWCSETLSIDGQLPAAKLFFDYQMFLTEFFDEKHNELGNKEYTLDYLENLGFREYIVELKRYFG